MGRSGAKQHQDAGQTVSLIRGESDIHTLRHKHNRLRADACTQPLYISPICYLCHILTKTRVMPKQAQTYGSSRKTMAATETPQHLAWKPGRILPAYVCVCLMHIHTLSIITGHILHPRKLHCTLAISSKEPSLINMQSIIHTFVFSVPFPLAGSNWLLSLDANAVGKGHTCIVETNEKIKEFLVE